MKALAWILIALSLVVAIVAAVTAYSPKLSLPDQRLVNLTLNAPAGVVDPDAWPREPLAKKDELITAELLSELRAAGVERFKVKEFVWRNWSGRWLFVLGCAGLLAGALMVRHAARQELAAAQTSPDAPAPPEVMLRLILTEVNALRSDLPGMSGTQQKLDEIIVRVGRLSAEAVPAFVAGRPLLVSRLGLGGYAQLMDRFAAGERQLNRCWSAAADGVEEEALDCLEQASVLLEEAEKRVG